MKNKKTLSITALVIGLFAISMSAAQSNEAPEIVFCEASECSKSVICDLADGIDLNLTQPTNVVGDVGFFEERIDGGLFTHSDALFGKVNATVGTLYGKDLITSLEYVDGKEDNFFGGFIGVASRDKYAGVRLATNYADGDLSDADFEFNFGYAYEPNFYDVLVGVDFALVSGGAYDVSVNVSRELISLYGVDVTGHVEFGKTWEYSDDYEYVIGGLRASYDLSGGTLYAQLSSVDNDIQTDGFKSVCQFGYKRGF